MKGDWLGGWGCFDIFGGVGFVKGGLGLEEVGVGEGGRLSVWGEGVVGEWVGCVGWVGGSMGGWVGGWFGSIGDGWVVVEYGGWVWGGCDYGDDGGGWVGVFYVRMGGWWWE
uniref:Uncharacterized protein n=1 Tax=Knipowitschia caucasica TaxID=637954 RepID=A0AAV2JKA0_KNICA